MKSHIRKAVELADGWRFAGPQLYGPSNYRYHHNKESGQYQVTVDALAAQLVRQVDALDTPDTVEVTHNAVWVGYRSKNNESWKRRKGADRTMNTIRAIVDSGVLTTGGSNNGN